MFSASGPQWKRHRQIINPTFSAAKLKEMLPLMQICTERFVNKMNENNNKELYLIKYIK
jgi:cytochrome P450